MINSEAFARAFNVGKAEINRTALDMIDKGTVGPFDAVKAIDKGYMKGMRTMGRSAGLSRSMSSNIARGVQAAGGVGTAAAVYNHLRAHPVGTMATMGMGSLGMVAAGSVLISQLTHI